MKTNQILATKSTSYIYAYIVSFVLSTIVAIIMFIPVFKIDNFLPYLLTSIIFMIIDCVLIYLIINFIRRPLNLILISDETIILNRSKKVSIEIPISSFKESIITISFFSIFLNNVGAITIKTNDNKKYVVGYIKDYIKISGQLNSIKYIKDLGEKL